VKPAFFFSITKKAKNEKKPGEKAENKQEQMPEKTPYGQKNTGNMANAF